MKKRYITTDFWRDSFIDELDPIEKLLFLYLICNPATNLCGIYQLPLRIIASDTGIDSKAVENIFEKFTKKRKAYYIDSWIILPNAPKHQDIRNIKIKTGIERELAEVDAKILSKMDTLSIPYIYPMDRILHLTKLNLTKLNLTNRESTPAEITRKFFSSKEQQEKFIQRLESKGIENAG